MPYLIQQIEQSIANNYLSVMPFILNYKLASLTEFVQTLLLFTHLPDDDF